MKYSTDVASFVSTYKPLYPSQAEDWAVTTEYMKTSPSDWEIVTALREELKTCGGFRRPVLYNTWDDEEEGTCSFVVDGTHRVVSTLLEGLTEIVVQDSDTVSSDDSKFLMMTVVLDDAVMEAFDVEEKSSELFNVLRSVKLNDEFWVVSDVCGGALRETSYYYSGAPVTDVVMDLLKERTMEKLAQIGLTSYLVSLTLEEGEEEDEDVFIE